MLYLAECYKHLLAFQRIVVPLCLYFRNQAVAEEVYVSAALDCIPPLLTTANTLDSNQRVY